MRVAVHRLGVDFNVVKSRDRHAFQKILDVSVTALSRIRVGLFVETKVLEVEDALVRAGQFFVLPEVVGEVPRLWLHRGFAKTSLHQPRGGLKVLVQQKARRHQGLADRVHVMAGVVLWEIRGQSQRIDAAAKQCRQRDFIFAIGKPTHHGASARAFELVARLLDAVSQLGRARARRSSSVGCSESSGGICLSVT